LEGSSTKTKSQKQKPASGGCLGKLIVVGLGCLLMYWGWTDFFGLSPDFKIGDSNYSIWNWMLIGGGIGLWIAAFK
jgi:predicted acyltransferase